jgi:hypothetical protein
MFALDISPCRFASVLVWTRFQCSLGRVTMCTYAAHPLILGPLCRAQPDLSGSLEPHKNVVLFNPPLPDWASAREQENQTRCAGSWHRQTPAGIACRCRYVFCGEASVPAGHARVFDHKACRLRLPRRTSRSFGRGRQVTDHAHLFLLSRPLCRYLLHISLSSIYITRSPVKHAHRRSLSPVVCCTISRSSITLFFRDRRGQSFCSGRTSCSSGLLV